MSRTLLFPAFLPSPQGKKKTTKITFLQTRRRDVWWCRRARQSFRDHLAGQKNASLTWGKRRGGKSEPRTLNRRRTLAVRRERRLFLCETLVGTQTFSLFGSSFGLFLRFLSLFVIRFRLSGGFVFLGDMVISYRHRPAKIPKPTSSSEILRFTTSEGKKKKGACHQPSSLTSLCRPSRPRRAEVIEDAFLDRFTLTPLRHLTPFCTGPSASHRRASGEVRKLIEKQRIRRAKSVAFVEHVFRCKNGGRLYDGEPGGVRELVLAEA